MKGLRPGWAVKAILVVIFTSMLFRCVSASDGAAAASATANSNLSVVVSVGGASGWDLSSNLQAWAAHTTFHVGDSLVFRYTPVHDVLEVKKMDYDMCHTVNPMETHNDGETVIQLREVGNRYFICGRLGHCAMGLKLHVHVFPALQMTPGTANSTSPTSSPSTPSSSTTTASGHDPTNNNSSSSHGPPSDEVAGNQVPNSQPPADSNYSYNAAAGNTSATSDAHTHLIVESSVTLLVLMMMMIMQQAIHPCSPLLFLIPCSIATIQLLVCF